MYKFVAKTTCPLTKRESLLEVGDALHSLLSTVGDTLVLNDDETIGHDVMANGPLGTEMKRLVESEAALYRKRAEKLKQQAAYAAPYQRFAGSLHFRSPVHDVGVHVRFDDYRLSPQQDELLFGNTVSIEFSVCPWNGGDIGETAVSFGEVFFRSPLFDYGYFCASDQYSEKNLSKEGGGVCAVGLDASRWLPGFYWANYFGDYLCGVIGADALKSTPGCHVSQFQSGILVVNDLLPHLWDGGDFVAMKRLL